MKSCVFLVLVLGFAALASAQTVYWQVVATYSDSACSNKIGSNIVDVGGICGMMGPGSVSCTQSGNNYYTMDCVDKSGGVDPFDSPIPTGWAVFKTWHTTGATCPLPLYAATYDALELATKTNFIIAAPDTCVTYGASGTNYFKLTTDCSASMTFSLWSSADCTGTPVYSYDAASLNSCLDVTLDTNTFDGYAYCKLAPPVDPPVSPPVAAPVAEPITEPIAAPMAAPMAAPIAAPVAAPVKAQTPAKKSSDAVSVAVSSVIITGVSALAIF